MRVIRFRAWHKTLSVMENDVHVLDRFAEILSRDGVQYNVMQFTGLKDKNGKDIYEGDVLEFADKWEWYKGSYGIKMHFAEPDRLKELREQYDKEPMERRVIEMPECYNWLLSSEIQTYWHVIGNIYESPNLKELKP